MPPHSTAASRVPLNEIAVSCHMRLPLSRAVQVRPSGLVNIARCQAAATSREPSPEMDRPVHCQAPRLVQLNQERPPLRLTNTLPGLKGRPAVTARTWLVASEATSHQLTLSGRRTPGGSGGGEGLVGGWRGGLTYLAVLRGRSTPFLQRGWGQWTKMEGWATQIKQADADHMHVQPPYDLQQARLAG